MNRAFPSKCRRRVVVNRFHRLLVCLLLSAIAVPVAVASTGGVDAVLLMDSSGSMAKNDPRKLRVPAAKMFMSLLGEKDRIGLISFSDNGYPVLHLTAPGPDNNARILASADKVSSKGVYTNLHAALGKGIAMLDREGNPGQEKILVLMSDGKMDVGDTDEDYALTGRVRTELLDSIKQKGIKVYTIAFTEASDVDLLSDVATGSGALFKLARSDKDLHEVFSAIFESAKNPDMLPIEGGDFVVDSSIEEVTIVASKEREDVRIFLQSPEGKKISADDAGKNVKWFMSHHFDMITLEKPLAGTWKLLFTGGKNRAYIVTNMALMHSPQQPRLDLGEDMVLEAWLEQDGKVLNKEAVLANTRFLMRIEAPDGATADFDLFDTGEYGDRAVADGIYANTLAYENPGDYKIDIIAESETFKRQKTVHFNVAAPPADLKKAVTEPAVDALPEPEKENAPESAPEVQTEVAEAVATTAGETSVGSSDDDEESAPVLPAEQPEKKKGINLGLAIGVFVGVNVLLGLIGFGIWWFLKKRKHKGAEGESDAEDEEA